MKNTQKGFTLVELIVVITILAILGTIAFISLQGYSQDARDSKVVSDVRSLASVIETKITEGKLSSLGSIVGTAVAGNGVTAVSGGTATYLSGEVLTGSTYNVGNIDWLVLQQDSSDFTDANGAELYRVATLQQTTDGKTNQMYQVAGLKGPAGAFVASIKGNYIYNAAVATDATGLVSDSAAATGLTDGLATTNAL